MIASAIDAKGHQGRVCPKTGGKVPGAPMAIPGVGWYMACADSASNRLSLLQPRPRNP